MRMNNAFKDLVIKIGAIMVALGTFFSVIKFFA